MSVLLQAVDAVSVLASGAVKDPVPSENQVKPGWIALGLMILMCVATWLLWVNMRRQIGKIDFEETPDPDGAENDEGADSDDADDAAHRSTSS